jgi:short subunit dehydrogenase-like uncharacterized protein
VQTGTHHVDLSGEPQFLESIQVDLHDKARDKGVYIVGCCGYDSVPSDFGIAYLKENNPDIRFDQVESYLLAKDAKGKSINHGTFDSLVGAIQHWSQIKVVARRVRDKFFTRPYEPMFALKKSLLPRKDAILNQWTMPFWETDKLVVRRTQMISYAQDPDDYPVQFEPYMYIPNPIFYVVLVSFLPFFLLLCLFGPTRKYVQDYPELFTLGIFSKDGPTDKQVKNSSFEQYMVAKGWRKNTLNGKQPTSKPDVTKLLHIKGPEVAYDATSIFILLSGITIIDELEQQTDVKPGVLTPGLAFRKTKLADRLRRNRIEFNQVYV